MSVAVAVVSTTETGPASPGDETDPFDPDGDPTDPEGSEPVVPIDHSGEDGYQYGNQGMPLMGGYQQPGAGFRPGFMAEAPYFGGVNHPFYSDGSGGRSDMSQWDMIGRDPFNMYETDQITGDTSGLLNSISQRFGGAGPPPPSGGGSGQGSATEQDYGMDWSYDPYIAPPPVDPTIADPDAGWAPTPTPTPIPTTPEEPDPPPFVPLSPVEQAEKVAVDNDTTYTVIPGNPEYDQPDSYRVGPDDAAVAIYSPEQQVERDQLEKDWQDPEKIAAAKAEQQAAWDAAF